jgi:hypothetical protein
MFCPQLSMDGVFPYSSIASKINKFLTNRNLNRKKGERERKEKKRQYKNSVLCRL